MLVIDSNVALAACQREGGFEDFATEALVAPPLMWSEFRSGLHEAVRRGEASRGLADATLRRLAEGRIRQRTHPRLGEEAWRIADAFGWYKTYDAEYVALGGLLGARVVTLDLRLRHGADRLGFVVTPGELFGA